MSKIVKHIIVGAIGAALTVYVGATLSAQLGFAGQWAGFVAGTVLIAVASWVADSFKG